MARNEESADATELRPLNHTGYQQAEITPSSGGFGNTIKPPEAVSNYSSTPHHTEVLRHFGPWQLRTLLLVALVKIPSAWQMAAILFTSPMPENDQYWCNRPEVVRHRDANEWKNYSHVSLGQKIDPCNIYIEAYNLLSSGELGYFSRENATVEPCTLFEYNTSATTITQWHLVCERQVLVSVSQFFYLLGILVGGALSTKLIARVAPKRVLLAGIIVQIVAGTCVTYSTFVEMQMFLRFVTAAACAHMFTSGYVICTGNSEAKTRLFMGSCYEHFWSVGVITLPCLASLFSDWRDLQLAISLPTIGILLAYRWIPESPTWLISAERYTEAKHILDKASRSNDEVTPLNGVENFNHVRTVPEPERPQYDLSVYSYFALHVAWTGTIVTYYGALLNVKSIGDHLYLYTGVAGAAEIVGVLFGLVCILQTSRKWTILGYTNILGGLLCFLSWILEEGDEAHAWVLLLIAMIARVAIAASLNMLTLISPELIPKSKRQPMMFSAVTTARIFLLSAPFIGSLAMYGNSVSLSAFGALTAITGFAVLPLQTAQNVLEKNMNF